MDNFRVIIATLVYILRPNEYNTGACRRVFLLAEENTIYRTSLKKYCVDGSQNKADQIV